MVLSAYFTKYPYNLLWHKAEKQDKLIPLVFYCGDPVDHYAFNPVNKYLSGVVYTTDKLSVKKFLKDKGIPFLNFPIYPKAVIMARHSAYKFPCKDIVRIGMRHGAFHFKKMTAADNYNVFDSYLMTSASDVISGKKLGINKGKAVGFPKLDPAFNGNLDDAYMLKFAKTLNLNPDKPVVLFTATYDSSGMSAIERWYDKLPQLTDKYNIMVTLHPWVKDSFRQMIRKTPSVLYIDDYDILPYIKLSDVVVGDTSSILAECCALDKPIITFKIHNAPRTLEKINDLIKFISYNVSSFSGLAKMIDYALANREEYAQFRAEANVIFFDVLDGKAGERAAAEIKRLIQAKR
jgi:CDP-glycerol glycerophosphotransferase (TagB/SpsB family)